MKQFINRVWEADPSAAVGWAISALSALLWLLLAVSPILDGVSGEWKAVGVVVFAIIPKLQGALIALKAYKKSTVEKMELAANAAGQLQAQQLINETSVKTAKKTKKATSVPESSPSPKPKVQKRSKKPVHVNPVSKQTPTKQP